MLRFDNTYSWTRSKELFYTIRVLPPDTELCEQEEEVKDEEEFVDCTEDNIPQNEEVTVAVNNTSLELPPSKIETES